MKRSLWLLLIPTRQCLNDGTSDVGKGHALVDIFLPGASTAFYASAVLLA